MAPRKPIDKRTPDQIYVPTDLPMPDPVTIQRKIRELQKKLGYKTKKVKLPTAMPETEPGKETTLA